MESFLENDCLPTLRSSCLSRGSKLLVVKERIKGNPLQLFKYPCDKCYCDGQSLGLTVEHSLRWAALAEPSPMWPLPSPPHPLPQGAPFRAWSDSFHPAGWVKQSDISIFSPVLTNLVTWSQIWFYSCQALGQSKTYFSSLETLIPNV